MCIADTNCTGKDDACDPAADSNRIVAWKVCEPDVLVGAVEGAGHDTKSGPEVEAIDEEVAKDEAVNGAEA